MKLAACIAVLLSLLLIACGGDETAATAPDEVVSLEDLVDASDVIVSAVVLSTTERPAESVRYEHEVEVDGLLDGSLRTRTITVLQSDIEPEFRRGQRYVLFLKKLDGFDEYETVHGAQGRFVITNGEVFSVSVAVPNSGTKDMGIRAEPLQQFIQRLHEGR